MDIKDFERTKDIRQRLLLAEQAAKDAPNDLLLHCQINAKYLADILQICMQGREGTTQVFTSLQNYYRHWNDNKPIQSVLLSIVGVREDISEFFLQCGLTEYREYVLFHRSDALNAKHVEMIAANMGHAEENASLQERVAAYYQDGALGFRTLALSFQGWLMYKIRGKGNTGKK